MNVRLQHAGLALTCCALGIGAVIAVGVLARRLTDARSAEADVDCVQLAAEFEEYALVFPGAEFEGLPLRSCERVQTPEKYGLDGITIREPAMDFFRFTYGDCEPRGEQQSCPRPIQVFVDLSCGPNLDPSQTKERITIRGLPVDVKYDASLRIETQDYKATIYALDADWATSKAKAVRVAESLRGANTLAQSLRVDQPLDSRLQAPRVC